MKLFLTLFLCYFNLILINCDQTESTENPNDNSVESVSENEKRSEKSEDATEIPRE